MIGLSFFPIFWICFRIPYYLQYSSGPDRQLEQLPVFYEIIRSCAELNKPSNSKIAWTQTYRNAHYSDKSWEKPIRVKNKAYNSSIIL